ncbi:MAG TPA: 30S ribosomal protein S11 [Fervidobacterium sp.]|nr:30S ribosomal protein S11 [Fervidobacterium sp.]HOH52795.1 30S ribosomal protein S11 [Fervidobacterium sp.]HPC24123.1 30S ribosomal protein S11 [Fervidobacterium sp.]HQO04833.1 30S ribosomal protein S11 [Fervidobacterium sp.]
MAVAKGRQKAKQKKRVAVDHGVVHIKSTYNNTIICLTDPNGHVLSWGSGGTAGFEGTRKGTPYASQLVADKIAKDAVKIGIKRVDVVVRGPGAGRETAIRTLQAAGIEVDNIKDATPIPFNGCRPPKRRRV